jgi:hypothetical protein
VLDTTDTALGRTVRQRLVSWHPAAARMTLPRIDRTHLRRRKALLFGEELEVRIHLPPADSPSLSRGPCCPRPRARLRRAHRSSAAVMPARPRRGDPSGTRRLAPAYPRSARRRGAGGLARRPRCGSIGSPRRRSARGSWWPTHRASICSVSTMTPIRSYRT